MTPASSTPSIYWFSETKHYSYEEPQQDREFETSNFTVPCCYCCRIYSYQYFIVLGSRFCYLFEFKNLRMSVFCAYNRFHLSILPFLIDNNFQGLSENVFYSSDMLISSSISFPLSKFSCAVTLLGFLLCSQVITAFPLACPSSRYRIASATSLNG